MPRAIWKGAISFGMVIIPVSVASVVDEKDVRFSLLHKTCLTRPKQQRWCEVDEEVVPYEDLVRAYEWAPDEWIVMDDTDFEKVQVESSRRIDIQEFVPLEQIDPVFFDNSYFLYPDKVGAKAYQLLRRALEEDQRVGIAKVTMRQREYLCAVRLYQDALMLNTLFYADEVRAVESEALDADKNAVSDAEVEMAKTLIGMMATDYDPTKYGDQYREGLLEIIDTKREGKVIELKPAKPSAGPAIDLTAALRASLEAQRKTTTVTLEPEADTAPKRARKKAS
jgi:DNA end-binding protein Ku